MRLLISALLVAGTLVLAGCGAAAGQPPESTASPAPNQLTDADGGKTFNLHVGDTIEVALHQAPGMSPWQNVQTSNPAILEPQVDTRAAAVRGVTLAMFRAKAAGKAAITATASAECSPGAACPALAQAWRVDLIVS
ncbi:MAG TPA: hypothetical protein VF134_02265 [Candidatus Dormibacteraeota bacterium]